MERNCEGRPELKIRISIRNEIRREVKDGSKTFFWVKNWCVERSFQHRFPLLFALMTNKSWKVSDRLLMYSGEIYGQWGWTEAPYYQAELNELKEWFVA